MKDKPVILVVDDQPQNIELLEAYLVPHGYEIIQAANGEEALGKLSGNQIDLILLDVMMPGMDGFEVTRRVRQDNAHRLLPIILITGLQGPEDRVKGIEAGCDDFLSKPYNNLELLARVRSLLKVKDYNDLMSNYQKDLESEVTGRTEELKHTLKNLQQEITERKQAEEELLKDKENFRRSLDESPLGVRILAAEGETIYVNQAVLDIYGYSSIEEMKRRSVKERYTPQGYAEYKTRKKKREQGEFSPPEYEVSIVRKNGEVRHLRAFRKEILWNGVKQAQIIYQDITDRKRAEEELQQSFERMRKALRATVQSISMIVEMKDPYTSGHQHRVADLARSIATEMGLSADRRDFIRTASAIHDIGKIALPAEILSKPTKLTDLEFGLIKTHSQSGYDILKDIEFPWPVADVVLQHHERMDGSGYPHGLKGENISLEARILAVADVVEAITSHRPYRPAPGIDVALEEISRNRGIFYDADAVDACLRLFREKGYTLVFKK
jgi:PAS domain S-box-containing protein